LINNIVQKISKAIDPEKIILFSSYARGDFSNESNADLFLLEIVNKAAVCCTAKQMNYYGAENFHLSYSFETPKK